MKLKGGEGEKRVGRDFPCWDLHCTSAGVRQVQFSEYSCVVHLFSGF